MSKKKQLFNKYIYVIVFLIILVCIFLFINRQKKESLTVTKTTESGTVTNGFFTAITPTIIESDDNLSTFIHPINHFSFKYPRTWQLILEKHNFSEDWYEVLLKNDENTFRIYFSRNGRDYPAYREVIEYKNLGGKNIKWVTLYNKSNKAVEAFTQFTNNDLGNNLIGLYIYLPEENQEEFIKQVEDVIASLK